MPICTLHSFGSARPTIGAEGLSIRGASTTQKGLRTNASGPKVWSHSTRILLLVPPLLSALCTLFLPSLAAQSEEVAYTHRTAATDFVSHAGLRYDGTQEEADTTLARIELGDVPWHAGTIHHGAGTSEKVQRRRSCSGTTPDDRTGQLSHRRLSEQTFEFPKISPSVGDGDRGHTVHQGCSKPSSLPLDAMNPSASSLLVDTVEGPGLPHDVPHKEEDQHSRRKRRGYRERLGDPMSVEFFREREEEVRSTEGRRHTAPFSPYLDNLPAGEDHTTSSREEKTPHLWYAKPAQADQLGKKLAVTQYPLKAGVLNTERETPKRVCAKPGPMAAIAARSANKTRAQEDSGGRPEKDGAIFEHSIQPFQVKERLHNHLGQVLKDGTTQERLQMPRWSTREGHGRMHRPESWTPLIYTRSQMDQHREQNLAEQLVGEVHHVTEKASQRDQTGTSFPRTTDFLNKASLSHGLGKSWDMALFDSQQSPSQNSVSEQNGCRVCGEVAPKQRRASQNFPPNHRCKRHMCARTSAAFEGQLRNIGGVLRIAATSAVDERKSRESQQLLQDEQQLIRPLGGAQTQVGSKVQIKLSLPAKEPAAASELTRELLHCAPEEEDKRLTGTEQRKNDRQPHGKPYEIHDSAKPPYEDAAEQEIRELLHSLTQHEKKAQGTQLQDTSGMLSAGTSKGRNAELPKTYEEMQAERQTHGTGHNDASDAGAEIWLNVRKRLHPTLKQQSDKLVKAFKHPRERELLNERTERAPVLRRLQQQQDEHRRSVKLIRGSHQMLGETLRGEKDGERRRHAKMKQALRTRVEAALNQQGRLLQADAEGRNETQVSGSRNTIKKELQKKQRFLQDQLQPVQVSGTKRLTLPQAYEKQERGKSQQGIQTEKSVHEPLDVALEQQEHSLQRGIQNLKEWEALGAEQEVEAELRRMQQQQEHVKELMQVREELRGLREQLTIGDGEVPRRQSELVQALYAQLQEAVDQQGRVSQAEPKDMKKTQSSGLNTETSKELLQLQRRHQNHQQRVQESQRQLQGVREAPKHDQKVKFRKDMATETNVQEGSDVPVEQQVALLNKELVGINSQKALAAETEPELKRLLQQQKDHLTKLAQMREDLRELRGLQASTGNDSTRRLEEAVLRLEEHFKAALQQQKDHFQTKIDSLERQLSKQKENAPHQRQKEQFNHMKSIDEMPGRLQVQHRTSGREKISLPSEEERFLAQLDDSLDWLIGGNYDNNTATKTTAAPPARTAKDTTESKHYHRKLPDRQSQTTPQPHVWPPIFADILWGAHLPSAKKNGQLHPVLSEGRVHTSEFRHRGAVSAKRFPAAWVDVGGATQASVFNRQQQHSQRPALPRRSSGNLNHTLVGTTPFTPAQQPEEEQHARAQNHSLRGLPRYSAKKKRQGVASSLKRAAAVAGAAAGIAALLYKYGPESSGKKPLPSLTEAYKKNMELASSAGLEGSAILR